VPLLVLVPWIPEIVRGSAAIGHTKVSPVYPGPSLDTLRDVVVRLAFGEHGTAHASGLRWLQFAAVAVVLALAVRLLPQRAARLLAGTALGVLVLHAVVHVVGPDVFAPRYLTELVPLGAAVAGIAVARLRSRAAVPVAAAALVALAVAVVVQRTGRDTEPDIAAVARLVAPSARGRTVLTNSAVVAYYLRDLHPRLDRPFGLGPRCGASCPRQLVVEDLRVANSPRPGSGPAHAFGPIYVRLARP
jgi:hypothetical protein